MKQKAIKKITPKDLKALGNSNLRELHNIKCIGINKLG